MFHVLFLIHAHFDSFIEKTKTHKIHTNCSKTLKIANPPIWATNKISPNGKLHFMCTQILQMFTVLYTLCVCVFVCLYEHHSYLYSIQHIEYVRVFHRCNQQFSNKKRVNCLKCSTHTFCLYIWFQHRTSKINYQQQCQCQQKLNSKLNLKNVERTLKNCKWMNGCNMENKMKWIFHSEPFFVNDKKSMRW